MYGLCLSVVSSFAILLIGKRELVALLLLHLMSCACSHSVSLPHCDVDWSAVCDCGIS